MNTLGDLLDREKAVIVIIKLSDHHEAYFYDLINHTVKKYKISDEKSYVCSSIIANNAYVRSTILFNESLIFDDHFRAECLLEGYNEYYGYLIMDGEVKIAVDKSKAYQPNKKMTVKSGYSTSIVDLAWDHEHPTDKTPHGLALFTIDRYKHILKSEETILKIMNADI
ncbi:hypothetical protein F-M6_0231 [Faustovirus]|nr:hypothetical protein F-M6_0231 [Faustovirus]